MDFTKRLREGVRRGDITVSVRIWMRPNVKVGNRYGISDGGEIEVDSVDEIELADITPKLARESGFASVVDLLKTAQHGRGRNVYLVRFHYVAPGARASASTEARSRAAAAKPSKKKKKVSADQQRN